MKKKIVACLLCMAMAVSTVPMPMVQAAEDNAGIVLYEEGTDTGNGEVTENFEEVDPWILMENAFASSERTQSATDVNGPAYWAFSTDLSKIWSLDWDNKNGKTPAYIGSSFGEEISLEKITYQSRQGEHAGKNRISKYLLYVTNEEIRQTEDASIGNISDKAEYVKINNTVYKRIVEEKGLDYPNGESKEATIEVPEETKADGFLLYITEATSVVGATGSITSDLSAGRIRVFKAPSVQDKENNLSCTVVADSEKTDHKADQAVDGDATTYWLADADLSDKENLKNNNYYMKLENVSKVSNFIYQANNEYEADGSVAAGAIKKANLYYTTEEVDNAEQLKNLETDKWKKLGTLEKEKYDSCFEKNADVTNFKPQKSQDIQEQKDVTAIRVEVIETQGNSSINAAEFAVVGKEMTPEEQLESAKSNLNEVLTEKEKKYNEGTNPGSYTSESWQNFVGKYEAAKELKDNTGVSLDEIRNAVRELKEAEEGLVVKLSKIEVKLPNPVASTSAPKAEIGEDLKNDIEIEKTEWKHGNDTAETIESYKDYTVSITLKVKNKNQVFASEATVSLLIGNVLAQNIQTTLQDNDKTLVVSYIYSQNEEEYTQKKTDLKREIDKAKVIYEQGNDNHIYTEASWEEFKKQYATANEVYVDSDSTIAELEKAYSDLKNALKPDEHKNLQHIDRIEATCTENGNIEYYRCNECGRYFEDAGGENEISAESVVLKATGHEWDEWKIKESPSETNTGKATRNCKKNNEHTQEKDLPKLTDENYQVDESQATCEGKWKKKYKYKFEDNSSIEFEREQEAISHNLSKTDAKEATCTAAGNSEYYTCSECGKYFSDAAGKNEIAESSWVIEAKGHKLNKTEAKAATCTEAGNSEYYTCSDCKKYFSDAAGKNEIAKGSWVIKAKGHTITKKETPATADREGKIEYSCDVCKNHVEKTFILPKTEISVYMGKTANLISDASKCSITLANAKKYKKYFTLDTKTGKIKTSTKKLSKVKIKKTIPVKVTVDGKAYNVNVKLKIAAPKIKKVTKKSVGSAFKYTFKYNIPNATKFKLRIVGLDNKSVNSVLDRYFSRTKSNKDSYIHITKSVAKKLGKTTRFKITAYYGKNVSETRIIKK